MLIYMPTFTGEDPLLALEGVVASLLFILVGHTPEHSMIAYQKNLSLEQIDILFNHNSIMNNSLNHELPESLWQFHK